MRVVVMAFAAVSLSVPAAARPPGVFVAILAEHASGFSSLADCERTIARQPRPGHGQRIGKDKTARGSLFNRAAGNITRCEMVNGEPLIVVIPRAR